ncbi:MAG: hypothetical protein A2Y07_09995 [Planctomycetes bacterium GWF2_50_10]|nr:MAG: hypothetical protein A2Y07_09995 [Planctomycetes bacterium GWF2_50_10]
MRPLALLIFIAAAFFFILFSPWTASHINFWFSMSFAAAFLSALAIYLQKPILPGLFNFKPSHIIIGIASAALLYCIFYIGREITSLLPFAPRQVGAIYNTRTQAPLPIISVLLLFIIGPAEEIFWRGFVQQRLSARFCPILGLIFASLVYALVHIWSFNLMLILAALVAGTFWGLIFLKTRSLWPVIISHSLWDFLIFVLLPL